METRKKTLLFCVYNHIEYFPPSINAILAISKYFNDVYLLQRPYKKNEWPWPSNIYYKPIHRVINIREYMKYSSIYKVFAFFSFTLDLFWLCKKKRPSVVLTADPFSFFSWYICSFFLKEKPISWYHSHDVAESKEIFSMFSIQYWAAHFEGKNFHKVDFFSLPSFDRLEFYNKVEFKGEIGILPNYPLLDVFKRKWPRDIPEDQITLIFLGSICAGRGLEWIIDILPCRIRGREIKLKIIGFVNNSNYLEELKDRISRKNVQQWVTFEVPVAYINLQNACEHGDIGLGFYLTNSNLDRTILTASNKIYEYAAMGMPVLSNIAIKNCPWCVTVQQDGANIKQCIEYVINNHNVLSKSALQDIENSFNFESSFNPFIKKILNSL
jgi:glycosyltransferase involved in cell wall biosynthesis